MATFKKRITVDIDLTPSELGAIFIDMPADDQAKFFAAAWDHSRHWKYENPEYFMEIQLINLFKALCSFWKSSERFTHTESNKDLCKKALQQE